MSSLRQPATQNPKLKIQNLIGGEVNASFLLGGFAQRVAFFYAPKIFGGRAARRAVAGDGAESPAEAMPLCEVKWRKLGEDLLLTAAVVPR